MNGITPPYRSTALPPASSSSAPAADEGNTEAAQQVVMTNLMALMAALMTATQSNNTPNLDAVQKSAQKVLASLPQGASPQWLGTVKDLADASVVTPAQLQSATTTLQASQLPTLPVNDPHAAGNRHHHVTHGNKPEKPLSNV